MSASGRRLLLIGANGQVGWELQRTLAPLGEIVAAGRDQLDLAKPDQITEAVRRVKPTVIVNAGAYTAVDRAEQESELAYAVNALAPGILAEEAGCLSALLIHYSTDYVFDGTKGSPYTEDDPTGPLNIYGHTKLQGEQAIQAAGTPYLILRTSWVYGWGSRNFLLTILRLARERRELRVVDDQIGAPTWCRFIAEATAQILAQPGTREHSGLYHLSASGQTTWYGFAKAILEALPVEVRPQLIPISTHEYPTPARRPAYSVLDNSHYQKDFGLESMSWDKQLQLVLAEGTLGASRKNSPLIVTAQYL
jgi:dTDP-4-dehydrorhamnose reductase